MLNLDNVDERSINKILSKYPDRIPVIITKGNKEAPDIDRRKYLVPKDITISTFIFVIRQRIKLKPDEALFVMVNNTLVNQSEIMSSVYKKYKSDNGSLNLSYSTESTFG
jgi:GABA(A) receptor-associated protein